eukprot:6205789-Pleurochrysis_carterae.AAC.3
MRHCDKDVCIRSTACERGITNYLRSKLSLHTRVVSEYSYKLAACEIRWQSKFQVTAFYLLTLRDVLQDRTVNALCSKVVGTPWSQRATRSLYHVSALRFLLFPRQRKHEIAMTDERGVTNSLQVTNSLAFTCTAAFS